MRATLRQTILTAVSLAIPFGAGSAQFDGLAPRSRVRVVSVVALDPEGRPVGETRTLTGFVALATRDSLVIRGDEQPLATTVLASRIVAVYASDGVHRHFVRGTLTGLGLGVGLGGILGYASGFQICTPTCNRGPNQEERAVGATIGGMVFGVLGASVGLILGAVSDEHWRQLEPPRRVTLRFVPVRRGASAGVGVQF